MDDAMNDVGFVRSDFSTTERSYRARVQQATSQEKSASNRRVTPMVSNGVCAGILSSFIAAAVDNHLVAVAVDTRLVAVVAVVVAAADRWAQSAPDCRCRANPDRGQAQAWALVLGQSVHQVRQDPDQSVC